MIPQNNRTTRSHNANVNHQHQVLPTKTVILKGGSGAKRLFNGSRARIHQHLRNPRNYCTTREVDDSRKEPQEGQKPCNIQVELVTQPFLSPSKIITWPCSCIPNSSCNSMDDTFRYWKNDEINYFTKVPSDVFIHICRFLYEDSGSLHSYAQPYQLIGQEGGRACDGGGSNHNSLQHENLYPTTTTDAIIPTIRTPTNITTTDRNKTDNQITLSNAAKLCRELGIVSKDFHKWTIEYLQWNSIVVDFRQYYSYRNHWIVPTMLWLSKNKCKIGRLHTALGERDVDVLLYFLDQCNLLALRSIFITMHTDVSFLKDALDHGVLPNTISLPKRGFNHEEFYYKLRETIQQPLAEIVLRDYTLTRSDEINNVIT